ncbi:MAG: transposase [Spirochaetales bacterium]|nr:transposase [Spirochaetales bacterium]
MSRPLRITYPGAFYQITARGNEQRPVFKSKRDKEKFLEYLKSASERYNAVIHVYCLMDNHHLLLETPSGNLPRIMLHINGAYTNYFNVKRGRAGHLFQGRYKAILVEKDEYAKELSRYIHLNPVRAGIVDLPEDYEWSSYSVYIGKHEKPEWLCTDFIHGYFGKTKSSAEKLYKKFVNSLINTEYNTPLDEVVGSSILGRLEFINEIKEKYLKGRKSGKYLPALNVLADSVSIDDIHKAVESTYSDDPGLGRNIKIYLARSYTGKRLREIGDAFGIGDTAVSQVCRRLSARIDKGKNLKKIISNIRKRLKL